MARPPPEGELARCTACDAPAFVVSPDGRTIHFKCARQGCDTWHTVTTTIGLVRERDGRETATTDRTRRRPARPAPEVIVEDAQGTPRGRY